MENFYTLVKTQLRAQLGLSQIKSTLKREKLKSAGFIFLFIMVGAELIGAYSFMMFKLYEGSKLIGIPEVILTFASITGGLLVLLFSIFYVLSGLFFAKDTEFLSSLPIKQSAVFASKLSIILLGEYPIMLFIMIPPIAIYGIGEGMGILYYSLALVSTIMLPIIPLAVSSMVSLVFMNIAGSIKRRDLFVTIGGVVLFVGIFVLNNMFVAGMPDNPDSKFMIMMVGNINEIVNVIGRVFVPSIWITKGLSIPGSEGLINIGYLFVATTFSMIVVYGAAGLVYQKGAIAQLETAKKNSTGKILIYGRSPLMAIFFNEWKSLLRTPMYALNSLFGIVMMPLLVIMPLFGGNITNDPDLVAIASIFGGSKIDIFSYLMVFAAITLFANINPAASTVISREGSCLWIMKTIPQPFEIQVLGKFLCGLSISSLVIVPSSLIAMFTFKLPLSSILGSIVTGLILSVFLNAVAVIIDILRPKLSWSSAQEVIKQNMNVIISMVVNFGVFVALGFLNYNLIAMNSKFIVIFAINTMIGIILSVIAVKIMLNISNEQLSRLEG